MKKLTIQELRIVITEAASAVLGGTNVKGRIWHQVVEQM